jgi:hypothetical protein
MPGDKRIRAHERCDDVALGAGEEVVGVAEDQPVDEAVVPATAVGRS